MPGNDDVIRVSLDDLEKVSAEPQKATTQLSPDAAARIPGSRTYGNIHAGTEIEPVLTEGERGSLLLQGWFYLSVAGLIGALIGWGICEPWFVDGAGRDRWANYMLLPMVIMMMVAGFAAAESIVERSWRKAGKRLGIAIPLGLVLGFVFSWVANIVFGITLMVVREIGVQTYKSPGFWIARAIAWAVFGIAGGVIYGLAGDSYKKGKYGVIGGTIGAGIGGILFDPISIIMGETAVLSRLCGFALFAVATGAAMGFVESALKDRWLYVVSGPLAGKQFILYKSLTTLGSDQQCDIYMFKDATISLRHATIELRGAQVLFRADAPVFVSGVPARERVLLNGDLVQIGRYALRYNERVR